jgi:hypothetical protein
MRGRVAHRARRQRRRSGLRRRDQWLRGALGFFSDSLLGAHPDRVKEGLKQAFHGLLDRDFDHLLFAHGEPVIGGGKAALRDFATSPVGHEDFGQAL